MTQGTLMHLSLKAKQRWPCTGFPETTSVRVHFATTGYRRGEPEADFGSSWIGPISAYADETPWE
jgi:hypothetical protein